MILRYGYPGAGTGSVAAAKITWVFTGDRWDSAPDRREANDFQYWSVLQFNDTSNPPAILPMSSICRLV